MSTATQLLARIEQHLLADQQDLADARMDSNDARTRLMLRIALNETTKLKDRIENLLLDALDAEDLSQ